MKKNILTILFSIFAYSTFAINGLSSNPDGLLKLGVRYNATFNRFEVYATPLKDPNSSIDKIAPAQITVAVPYGFRVTDPNATTTTHPATDMVSVVGAWEITQIVDAATSTRYSSLHLGHDFIVFGKAPSASPVTWTKNVPVVLFYFPAINACQPGLRPIDNSIPEENNFIITAYNNHVEFFDNSINLQNNPISTTGSTSANQENFFLDAPYPGSSCTTVSGVVWNDFNGNKISDAIESVINGTNLGAGLLSGAPLYVNMADANGKAMFSTPVNIDGTYSFKGVPDNATGLQLQLSTVRAVAEGLYPTQGNMDIVMGTNTTLPGIWKNVSVNTGTGNAATQGTNPAIITLNTTGPGDVINQNFGIERTPIADDKAFQAPNASFTPTPGVAATNVNWPTPNIGAYKTQSVNANSATLTPLPSSTKVLSGSDPEDCLIASSCATAKKFQVAKVNVNTLLYYYDGTAVIPVVANTIISNFNPASLRIYGQSGNHQGLTNATSFGFTYSLIDAAGMASTPANYQLRTATEALPVKLISFEAAKVGQTAALTWKTAAELNNDYFEVAHSTDAINWKKIGTVKGHGTSSQENNYSLLHTTPANGKNYYHLVQVDLNGTTTTSEVRTVIFDGAQTDKLSIYPNPATTALYVAGGNGSITQVSIYNAAGALITSQKVATGDRIDITRFAAGMYEVHMVQDNNLSQEKITISK